MKELTVYEKKAKGRISGGFCAGTGFTVAVILLCAVCALTWGIGRFAAGGSVVSVSHEQNAVITPLTVVIDAGHGGMDGGASGADGTVEKDINLAVAKRLSALLKLSGIECVMTREEDRMLVGDDVKSHRKMHDLKNRLAMTEEILERGGNAIFVSIHMNNFSSPKYYGLQVWYSGNNADSSQLASYVQSYAATFLDTSNKREIKRATSAIYILDRATVPAVLVECGFLSNPEECEKLKSESYQTELAVTVFSALCAFVGNGNV